MTPNLLGTLLSHCRYYRTRVTNKFQILVFLMGILLHYHIQKNLFIDYYMYDYFIITTYELNKIQIE